MNPNIDTNTQYEIIQNLTEKIRTLYVLPDIAEEICQQIKKHLDVGDYADITEGKFFAYALTQHLQETSQDEHLWVRWHAEPLPDKAEALRENPVWEAEQKRAAALDNDGFYRVERLPGNIGYLDIRFFYKPSWGGETAVAAMNLIANTSALIIDLRKCPGGSPDMVTLILSYFFGEKPVHLNTMYWRDEDFEQQYWTFTHVPGKRFGDKPVYALISRETFSGGEEFAYDLQAQQRGTIIGEKTDGGAHASTLYRLHPYLEASIPVGRAINPITNDNWQTKGVIPDIATTSEQAFDTAYKLALKNVVDSIGESDSNQNQKLLREAQTALKKLYRIR
jgi:C-terminal processing protease CtpA/Prc